VWADDSLADRMAERTYEHTAERVFAAPRDLVWALVADTNRWDRAAGMRAASYTWREIDGKRERFGSSKELAFDIRWIEPPYEWIEGRFVQGERSLLDAPLARGGFRVRLEDAGPGSTRVIATSYVGGGSALSPIVGRLSRRKFKRALAVYLDSIEAVLARRKDVEDLDVPDEPAISRGRRLLLENYDPIMSGPRTLPVEAELGQRGKALMAAPVERETATKLLEFLRERADEDVAQIRPFELARAWRRDRGEVLRAFLHATRAGLVDLRWQINCPVCRVAARIAGSLAEVGQKTHCAACNIAYDVDFGSHVEAVFQSSPAVRAVGTAVYCASSPAFQPHVLAQLCVAARARREEPVDLPPGTLLVRTLSGRGRATLELAAAPAELHIVALDDSLEVEPRAGAAQPGAPTRLVVESSASAPTVILIERSGWSADAVLGTIVATFPDFLDLFAMEAPATGVDLSIGHVAILFSDLTGSTALYERIGDAKAFAVVEEHFRLMSTAIAEHSGAVVKTMGDAVMATFASAADAVRAALAMIDASDRAHATYGLGLKLGVHAGPCLVVRANDRIDFFGTTVNIAARLQGQASAGHVVLALEVAEHPAVRALIEGRPRRRFDASLKGLGGTRALVAVDLGAQAERARARSA